MGVRNNFWEKYGGAKYFLGKIWGRETFFVKNMGARNIFWGKYVGASHFLGKIWGCEFFLG